MVKIYRECEQFMEEEEFVLHSDYAAIKSHLTAIAAVLGVPDCEPGKLAGVVAHWLDVAGKLLDNAADLEKECDELRAQRYMLVEALEKLLPWAWRSECPSKDITFAQAALAKVRGEG